MSSLLCPCGTSLPFISCCGRFHAGEPPETAEQLMRSRYCAFVLRDAAYLLRTWDPRTRPATLDFDDSLVWQGLEIVRTVRGQAEDTLGMVHFRAHYRFPTETGFSADVQEERSKFTRESTDSQWLYLD